MDTANQRAFTLIELLIVIGIVAILAAIVFPVYSSVQLTGQRSQSLSNMRQFGTALLAYTGDNNGQLPTEGSTNPVWGTPGATLSATEATAWYNVLPEKYGNTKGVADYTAAEAADFYSKNSLFYVPAAKYPTTKLKAPLFAVAFCSKLFDGTYITDNSIVRLQNFSSPTETVIFQESGLLGETQIRTSQSAYNGQSKSFASRSVARYGGQTVLVFADGHAGLMAGTDIVATSGKAYLPQIGPNGGRFTGP